MAKELDDIELLAAIEQEESVAYGINDAQLTNERAQSLRYYLGEPPATRSCASIRAIPRTRRRPSRKPTTSTIW
jgi:hypothetical protein